jgi:hypothetical protein
MSKKKVLTDQELADRKAKKAAYMRAWKEKNKEHVKEYNDAYFEENRDYNKERCKNWKRNNRQKVTFYNRAWNNANKVQRGVLNKRWREAHPEYRSDYLLGYNYNLTIEDYARMLNAQDGHCATCPATEPTTGRVRRLHVDHDHSCCPGSKSCGRCVRGLLCSTCNMALGGIKEDIEILQNMIAYVKRTKWINAKGETG